MTATKARPTKRPSKQPSLKWWYYYCIMGPGHQSSDDGYIQKATGAEVKEWLEDHYADREWPIFNFWEIKSPPRKYLQDRVESCQSQIIYLTNLLRFLKLDLAKSQDYQEDGGDDEIAAALAHKKTESVLRELHKVGIIVNSSDIHRWENAASKILVNSSKRPLKRFRAKALVAIKKAKSYPRLEYTRRAR